MVNPGCSREGGRALHSGGEGVLFSFRDLYLYCATAKGEWVCVKTVICWHYSGGGGERGRGAVLPCHAPTAASTSTGGCLLFIVISTLVCILYM